MKTTPEAIAVACFTLVVTLLLGGWQQVTVLTARLFGPYVPGMGGGVEVTGALVVAALAVGALVAALRVAGPGTGSGWAGHLAGATAILGSVVVLASIVSVLATLVGNG